MFSKMFTIALVLTVIAICAWYANVAEAQTFVTKGLIGFWKYSR